jgi:hypothetical protein
MKSSAPGSIACVFSGPVLDVIMITGSTAVSARPAEPPADRIAVHLRHHHVEEHEVGIRGLDDVERARPSVAETTS